MRALLLAPVLALVVTWPALAPTDPDYWWHARTGQLIVETGAIPHTDVFSYTAAGQSWIAHEWLTEVIFFLVQEHVGYAGNVLLVGLLGALAALALFATCRRWGLGDLPSVVLVLWAFGMSLGSLGVRPQSLTRVLLALSAFVLTAYRQQHDRRLLLVFPPLLALWSNLHGGFAIGLGLLGLTCAGDAIDGIRARSATCVWPLVLATGASLAATLLNPNGVAGVLYPLTYAMHGYGLQQVVAEWQPPDLRQVVFAPFGLSLLLALVLGVAWRPLGTSQTLWVVAFSLLAVQSVRNIQLYATVAMPLVGARLAAEFPALRRTASEWRRPIRMAVLWSAVAALSAAVWITRFTQANNFALQIGTLPVAASFPVGGAAYLGDHDVPGNIFNQFEWGGYLIFGLYPERHVFIDGRPDMYGDRILQDYVTVINLMPGWRDVLDTYRVRLVLVDREGALSHELLRDPAWHELYTGSVERLFERT